MNAERIFQAVMRFYTETGYACLPEFTLKTNRRPDITCLHKDGTIIMIEVKSSVTDFKTDKKWHEYAEWADALYFACLLYTSPSPRDYAASRMPSSA